MTTPRVPTGTVVVLAGPGVVDDGAIDDLRTFAAAGNLGVANTWGAKGVFAWDSPHHLGTCGLQAHDFELLGWADADAIVTTGIDDAESPHERFALAPVTDVAPLDLAQLAGQIVLDGAPPENTLYPRLAAVAQPGYRAETVPLHPARAVADLGAALPPGGLLTADPGVAGLWVARTFPTPALSRNEARRVVVPARRDAGIAARLAVRAAETGRAAVAVSTAPLDDATLVALADAERRALPVVMVVWGESGDLRSVDDHAARLSAALAAPGPAQVDVPIDFAWTADLIEAAGAVVAWGGLGASPYV